MSTFTPSPPERWRRHLSKDTSAQERVQALQDTDRLAIHVIEPIDRGQLYPTKTRELLSSNEAVLSGKRKGHLEKKDVALFSMSLLPNTASGKSITPYHDSESALGDEIAYGFNLDERQPSPARAIRVFRHNGNTGGNPYDKEFQLMGRFDCQQMAELYEPFAEIVGARDIALLNAAFKDGTLSGRQLDILAKYFKEPTPERKLPHNEIVAAAAPRHAETILIPACESGDLPSRISTPVYTFAGALSGIEHARNGVDLPVMLYHVNGSHRGKCIYVAQGEAECRAAALDAVRTLNSLGKYHVGHINEPLRDHGKRLLGLDVYQPPDELGLSAKGATR